MLRKVSVFILCDEGEAGHVGACSFRPLVTTHSLPDSDTLALSTLNPEAIRKLLC